MTVYDIIFSRKEVSAISVVDIVERRNNYDKDHCWQYDMRLSTYEDDLRGLEDAGVDISDIKISDFTFKPITLPEEKEAAKAFILRYEWLGTITQYTTHWFGAYYGDILAGVITFSIPNAFSKLLGEGTKDLERLLSRGACISWSPKGLASAFVMWCIRYMVKTTQYRLFTAYSDPTAKEIGTIYQACNFYYLGQNSGTTTRYINPYTGKVVSDRFFRTRSAYRRFAKELGIQWEREWVVGTSIQWGIMPPEVVKALKDRSKEVLAGATPIEFPSKHKYAYVLGVDKRETKYLRRVFTERNTTYEYPKRK